MIGWQSEIYDWRAWGERTQVPERGPTVLGHMGSIQMWGPVGQKYPSIRASPPQPPWTPAKRVIYCRGHFPYRPRTAHTWLAFPCRFVSYFQWPVILRHFANRYWHTTAKRNVMVFFRLHPIGFQLYVLWSLFFSTCEYLQSNTKGFFFVLKKMNSFHFILLFHWSFWHSREGSFCVVLKYAVPVLSLLNKVEYDSVGFLFFESIVSGSVAWVSGRHSVIQTVSGSFDNRSCSVHICVWAIVVFFLQSWWSRHFTGEEKKRKSRIVVDMNYDVVVGCSGT